MLSESVGRGSPFILAIWSDGPYCDLCGAAGLGAKGARGVGPLGASRLYLLLGGYRPVFWALAGALAVVGAVVAVAARNAREPAVAPGA